jgi:hypothetical protein
VVVRDAHVAHDEVRQPVDVVEAAVARRRDDILDVAAQVGVRKPQVKVKQIWKPGFHLVGAKG